MTHVIMIIEDAGALVSSHHGRKFVSFFDPDGYGGRGRVNTVSDPDRAVAFQDAGEAFEYWKQQSTTHPLRDDGKPNRPLTAYSVNIMSIEEARKQ